MDFLIAQVVAVLPAAEGATASTAWIKDYADGAAVFVAVLAFVIACITTGMQHRHNKMSVVPLPDVKYKDLERHLCIEVVNNGNGPMIVESFRVLRSGAFVSDALYKAIPEVDGWEFFVDNVDGRSLRAGDSVMLLEQVFSAGSRDLKEHELIRKVLGELTVEIRYTDIYGSKTRVYLKSLKWFHRLID